MNKNVLDELKKGETVFCINEGAYAQHLTKRKAYQIEEIGTDSKEGKVQIRGDRNRLVWISDLHFSNTNQAEIQTVNIDDEVKDLENAFAEITITFSNGKKRWLTVMTPKYLQGRLEQESSFFNGHNIIFINKITLPIVEAMIYELDRTNELLECSAAY